MELTFGGVSYSSHGWIEGSKILPSRA